MAVEYTYIPITYADLNAKKSIEISGIIYTFRLRENNDSETPVYSLDVFDNNESIIYTGPIYYGRKFVHNALPFQITPLSPEEFDSSPLIDDTVSSENLGVTTLLMTEFEDV